MNNMMIPSIIDINIPSGDYVSNIMYTICKICYGSYNTCLYHNNRYICKVCLSFMGAWSNIILIPSSNYIDKEIKIYILICNLINKSLKNILDNDNILLYLKEVYIYTLPNINDITKDKIIILLNKYYNTYL